MDSVARVDERENQDDIGWYFKGDVKQRTEEGGKNQSRN